MSAGVNSWIAYCGLKHRKTPLLDFIVPLAEALMNSGKLSINAVEELNAQPKHHEAYSMLVTICQKQQKHDDGAVNVHDKRRNRTLK
ncbi:hypothetical protein TNCT_112911 [Trichonephila clavata]|uniref:Uncharacterized protein n=1 Tax=Trichonephila clavata TaxID=2740835 RepID=A0A8X6ICB1_TRICU|nr:hypothetical protein TNCT_112911 [Trichonephila clavata]